MLNLVNGKGSLESGGACWMSLLNWQINKDTAGFQWTDQVDCVDPVIQSLCIRVNDKLSDEARTRVIYPHRFAPVGTAQGRDLMLRRMFRVTDEAVRVWSPFALDNAGLCKEADA